MKVAVIGTGNVGWALVALLARQENIHDLMVWNRTPDKVQALIMDVWSATSCGAEKVRYTLLEDMSNADVVVLTCGLQMSKGQTSSDVLAPNIEITRSVLSRVSLKPSALLIALATPVDDITLVAQALTKIPPSQVFGFGGDLDCNRLRFVVRAHGIAVDNVEFVGEHGRNAIPVYSGEFNYHAVAKDVRGYLGRVTALAGETRNLSTAILLADLIETITSNAQKTHYVCGFHPEFNIYLSWGFDVGRAGIVAPKVMDLSKNARNDLSLLIEKRRQTCESLLVSLTQA